MKALIVDDDEVVRKLMKLFLGDYFELTLAKDGPEAIAAFKGAMEKGAPFGLVCVDIMMPQMSGVEVVKQLRAIESEGQLYGDEAARVLMVTAVVEKNTVAQAFREGCDGYVIKPLERNEVLRQLSALKIIADAPSDSGAVSRRARGTTHEDD